MTCLLEDVVKDEIWRINQGGALRAPIDIDTVAEALSALDGATAFSVLEDLISTAHDTEDPNSWLCEAARAAYEEPFSPDDEVEYANMRKEVLNLYPRAPNCPPPAKMRRLQERSESPERDSTSKDTAKGKGKFKGKLPGNAKTQLCRNFARGTCKAGESCSFAHSEEEREAALERQLSSLNRQLTNFKTSMCDFFLAGKCRRGERCTFAHSQDELQGFDGASPPRTPPMPEEKGGEEAFLPATPPSEGEPSETELGFAAPQTP